MKKQISLFGIFILCLLPYLKADEFAKNHGIGVIHISFDSLVAIDLWESPGNKTPSHFMEIRHDSASPALRHISFDGMKQDSFPSWFTPLVFYSDIENHRLDINCLGENAQYYKTNLKCESGKFIWIQKSKGIQFRRWIDFYLSVASVEYNSDTAMLFEKPNVNSRYFRYIKLPQTKRIQVKPIEIKGEWMKVEIFDERQGWNKFGWIRWHDEKDPLIRFNLMGC